jgi:NitT/TauT family transport system ATP-binding protein
MRFGDLEVLRDINFSMKNGEFVCLIGPSGCGKTTLLRVVAGLEEPTEGELLLDGVNVTGPGADRGFVFQDFALFPWRTVRQNVEFGLELRDMDAGERNKRASDFIDSVNLTEFENYYPYQLSGGMQQRVGIARALVNEPKLLLMDEPFGSLDAQTRNFMQQELLDIWERGYHETVLFVTHSVDEAVFLADRVFLLSSRPGRLLKDFSVDVPRPRTRTDPKLVKVREHLLKALVREIGTGDGQIGRRNKKKKK